MKLKVPHYWQKDIYSCGPASLQMVFSFFGKKQPQKKVMKFAGVTKKEIRKIGTPNHKMVEAARKLGFYCYVNNNAPLDEIKYYIRLGLPVIVNFTEPTDEESHFGVVFGYSDFTKKIFLNDSYNGKNFKLSEKQFLRRWRSKIEKQNKRWLLVINKKQFSIGRQFLPLNASTPVKLSKYKNL